MCWLCDAKTSSPVALDPMPGAPLPPSHDHRVAEPRQRPVRRVLDGGAVVIVLVSGYRMFRKKAPQLQKKSLRKVISTG